MAKREVCWDMHIVEKNENVKLTMHKPVKKNIAFEFDTAWEGAKVHYLAAVKEGEKYRLYYRGEGDDINGPAYQCVAESDDGITYTRPNLGMFEFEGSKNNNIHHIEDADNYKFTDNFSIFKDPNPNCPPDAKYKSLSLQFCRLDYIMHLYLYKSADGLKFERVGEVPVPGVFDSYNTIVWDDKNEEYKLYIRDFHDKDGNDIVYRCDEAFMDSCVRDIRVVRTKDFVSFSKPERIKFEDNPEDFELYTNQIFKYHRADIYLGMPTRYKNRIHDAAPSNFDSLPSWGGERKKYIEKGSRHGSANTDSILMTSRDGVTFKRHDEAFMAPELEEEYNWVYGDCYPSYGVVETKIEGSDKYELSFYLTPGYSGKCEKLARYTVRLDGFFSWSGDVNGASLITKPLMVDSDDMSINFETSAVGGIRIQICDKDGNEIEGYDSGILYGNSLDRKVVFEKPLKDLKGKEIKIKFHFKSCNLYSFVI